ncbi:MAG: BACON domain-containing protein [Tannerella sp.]|jgi:hypothetical protein|nr:BACON domain-containing protein [Tannerella sp.]
MKTNILQLTAVLLILAGSFSSCENREGLFLTVDETPVSVTAKGGTYFITVNCNSEWTAVLEGAVHDWGYTLTNVSGANDGVVTVGVAENTDFTPRSATVIITSGSLVKTVAINQSAGQIADSNPLDSTEWKLSGIVDAQTVNLQELEPKGYNKCYTFRFKSNSTYVGYSSFNYLGGSYIYNYETGDFNFIGYITLTEAGETHDGKIYLAALFKVQSFSLKEDELRLYYDSKKKYLLYKPYEL